MTDTKHTPTPWGISGNLLVSGDRHVQNNRVGATFNYRGNAKANAAFIVRAVNAYPAHEATIAALTTALVEVRAHFHTEMAPGGRVMAVAPARSTC